MSLLQASLLRRNTKREHKSVGLVLSFPAFCFLLCGLSQFVCFNATNLMWEYKHVLREDIPSPWLALGIDFFFFFMEKSNQISQLKVTRKKCICFLKFAGVSFCNPAAVLSFAFDFSVTKQENVDKMIHFVFPK